MTPSRADKATLLLLAAAGLVGLFVARRYGLVHGLRTVNRALGVARVVRTAGRTRSPRRVQPKAVAFSR